MILFALPFLSLILPPLPSWKTGKELITNFLICQGCRYLLFHQLQYHLSSASLYFSICLSAFLPPGSSFHQALFTHHFFLVKNIYLIWWNQRHGWSFSLADGIFTAIIRPVSSANRNQSFSSHYQNYHRTPQRLQTSLFRVKIQMRENWKMHHIKREIRELRPI